MSSKKRRAARRLRLACRALEQFWRKPEREVMYLRFAARHGALSWRGERSDLWAKYWDHLRSVGIDPAAIARRGSVVYRRV